MSDATLLGPKSHRRLYLILAAIAVVVIALIVGAFLYASSAGSSKASDYNDNYAAWQAKDKPILLAATAALPKGTYLSKDVTTTKALATQKEGCDAVAAQHKKLIAAASRLPTVGNGLLGTFSSDYGDAGDKSDHRKTVVQAYLKKASATLAQIERDCRWNIDFNAAEAKPDKLWASSVKYNVKPGGTEPGGIFCAKGKTSCVSSIAKKKNKYADLRIKAIKLYRAQDAKFYGSKECKATSYGSACAIIAKTSDAYHALRLKNYQYIRTMKSSVNNSALSAHNTALDELNASNMTKIRKAVLALRPELKEDKKFQDAPLWTDHFFAQMGKLGLADLEDGRAAIKNL